jgi:hypothetical protein
MKTDLAELSSVYQRHLRDHTGEAAAPCPGLERLAESVMGKVSKKERAAIVAHAANCSACAAALKSLLQVSRETDRVAAGLEAYAGHGESERIRTQWARRARPFLRPAVAAAAGILVIAVLIVAIPGLVERSGSGTRGGAEAGIALVSPGRAVSIKDGLEFRWQGAFGADFYTVEVFDRSFRLLWRSGRVAGTETPFPAEAFGLLKRGESYYWTVTAVTGNEAEIKSRLAEFSVR